MATLTSNNIQDCQNNIIPYSKFVDTSIGKLCSIGDNVRIGTNVIILDGVSIKSHSVIAVGAVVKKMFLNMQLLLEYQLKLLNIEIKYENKIYMLL